MGRAARSPRAWTPGARLAAALACVALAAAPARGTQPFACGTLSGAAATTCLALGDVYVALNGSTWRANTGWAQAAGTAVAPDVCAFYGVTCDANGQVTRMCVPRQRSAGLPLSRASSCALGRVFVRQRVVGFSGA